MDIGSRLHAVRTSKGLSQRELAKRVGVTNSTISLIEQNKVSPSVGSLKKVLDGIPISLADFFTLDLAGDASDGPYYGADDLPDVGNNDIHYFLVGKRRGNRQMCILREVMPPGTRVHVSWPRCSNRPPPWISRPPSRWAIPSPSYLPNGWRRSRRVT